MSNYSEPAPKKPDTPGIGSAPKAASPGLNVANNTREPSAAVAAQAAAMATTARAKVTAAKRVVVATVNDPTLLAMSIAAIAGGIVRDRVIADLPVDPVSAITILSPSGSRVLEAVKTFTRKDVEAQLKTVLIGHCNSFNPLCPEGAHILRDHLNAGACVVTYVAYKDLRRDEATGVLTHLTEAAEKFGARLIIFVVCTKKQDTAWLRAYAGEFVEVSKCEPGPGAQMAILLTNVSLADRHEQGIGRVMIEAFVDPNGVYSYRAEPFIAERAIIRLAWFILRWAHRLKEDVPLAKIAQVVGIVPSNISRGITPLLISPKNAVGVGPSKGCFDRWAADYNLELIWPREKPDQGASAGVVGEAAKGSDSPKAGGTDRVSKDTPAPDRVHPATPNGGKP